MYFLMHMIMSTNIFLIILNCLVHRLAIFMCYMISCVSRVYIRIEYLWPKCDMTIEIQQHLTYNLES